MTLILVLFFFFNDTATTEIYTLSLHDALPIFLDPDPAGSHADWLLSPRPGGSRGMCLPGRGGRVDSGGGGPAWGRGYTDPCRSGEHTSELPSRQNLVCRLLLGKKKTTYRFCPL